LFTTVICGSCQPTGSDSLDISIDQVFDYSQVGELAYLSDDRSEMPFQLPVEVILGEYSRHRRVEVTAQRLADFC
jgi:hypothetical protein